MKRYLLFTFYAGRPFGGMQDYVGSFETVAEALENLLPERGRYYQLFDGVEGRMVREGLSIYRHFSPEYFQRWLPPEKFGQRGLERD